MLRVDNWLDVASLENVEEDHSFLFLKKNLMKIIYLFIYFFVKELKILIDELFFFFFENLEFFEGIENFGWWNFYFIFFLKELKILIDDFFIIFLFFMVT